MTTMLLSAADIAGMRATLNRTLPDTATILSDTQVPDGAGGYTVTTATSAPVACRVAPSTVREATIAGRLDAVGLWTLTFPAETVVLAPNRVAVGSRTFEVVAPLRPRSWELSRRVVCTETL